MVCGRGLAERFSMFFFFEVGGEGRRMMVMGLEIRLSIHPTYFLLGGSMLSLFGM